MKSRTELLALRMAHLALAAMLLIAGSVLVPSADALAQGQSKAIDAPKPRNTGEDSFLPVDEAFKLGTLPGASDQARLVWQIADGYYLYHQRIKVKSPDPAVTVGAIDMPPGQIKNDEFFGRQEIYHHELTATVHLTRSGNAPTTVPLQVTYQGCAEAGLCFPPVTKTLNVSLPGGTAGGPSTTAAKAAGSGGAGFVSEQDSYARIATSGNFLLLLAAFFGGGLLVACTPCVLPMVAILFAIIGGQKELSASRAFGLSLTYVLGMAFTYSVAGAVTALAGSEVQALFQQAWVLVLFAALLAAMSLAMFGAFTVQMPSAIQSRVTAISNRQSAGTFGGVAAMGALSALIVTTCVAPVLVGALAVISQTGNPVRGATALFAMSMGMGAPLLVLGATQGKFMPKLGPWMETVKHLCGALLLAVAVWLLDRVVPGRLGLALWALPAGAAAWVLIKPAFTNAQATAGAWIGRTVGALAAIYGVAVLAGAAIGATDPLSPLSTAAAQELPFQTIKSVADLDRVVAAAHGQGKTVMLDFYADWCTSCKEMQKYTFTDHGVQAALTDTVLLRADVTANDADDQALMHRFNIQGPPTIAFYDKSGQEQARYRVVGYMKAADFAPVVRQALNLQAATHQPPAGPAT